MGPGATWRDWAGQVALGIPECRRACQLGSPGFFSFLMKGPFRQASILGTTEV